MKTPARYSFPKAHRLTHKKVIDQVFRQGKPLKCYPLLAFYGSFEGALQAGFAVPKRKIQSAVKRNRIRRKLREAFRLQKQVWQKSGFEGLKVMFVYLPDTERDYGPLAEAMAQLLRALEKKVPPEAPSGAKTSPHS